MKYETIKPVFFLALACERIFIKTRGIESKCAAGPEKYNHFAGASVHLSVYEILQSWAVKGLR